MAQEAEKFIKVKGEEYAWGAINIVESDTWIEFDRVNTKSGEISGHYKLKIENVDSVETRK